MAVKIPYTPKEISWLSFNERVLQEAADSNVPLFERIKFLGIYSSNMDEFFRVRVATLNRLANVGKSAKKYLFQDPSETLKSVKDITLKQAADFERVYQDILKELGRHKIHIIDETQLSRNQGQFVRDYFQREVRSKLFPIMLDEVNVFPEMRDDFIYLAVCLSSTSQAIKKKYALIEVPTDVIPRFLILPEYRRNRYIMLLDDVIRYNLKEIFSIFQHDTFDAYTVKLTRDSELDIADDINESYIKKVSSSLKQRKEGAPVRIIYDADTPDSLMKRIRNGLKLDKQDTFVAGSRYHNFKDFMKFPSLDSSHLKYEDQPQLSHPRINRKISLFDTIDEQDFLLHYPYQSFSHVIDLLREASIDPHVTTIRFTVYRVAKYSSVMNALINAVKNGKKVVVVLELQARFDEEANIFWANKLQEEGVRVIYGVPGLKVHSKLCLITRKVKGKVREYAIIGTGNYNEITAGIYSDHSLFTSNPRLTKEVCNIFNFFDSNYNIPTFNYLLVSPFDLRKKISKYIKREIKHAQEGQEAYIIIKVNNLVDTKIIKLLYDAANAGVNIKLIVRSMFSLIPGVPGFSDNVKAISIVDKYLEHSRIFLFCNGGKEKVLIGSADLMQRNLDRRVEVICPIYDASIKAELKAFLQIQLQDNTRARVLDQDLTNQYQQHETGGKAVRAQWDIYDFLKNPQ